MTTDSCELSAKRSGLTTAGQRREARGAAARMRTKSLRIQLQRLFNLKYDQAPPQLIDATIRDGVRFGGTNLWVLICAILIASIGLNVNSTAVIIGAMLISPLMGSIIGIGYAVGINDTDLMRQSMRNLLIFVGISLATSTLYFSVTPLTGAQSELLARTSPAIWDVLIAFFGGAAGMIGLTRKEKSNLVPGVAIATALMPPLCTAGYGLATWEPRFFLGAAYLFTINGVFIAFATLVLTRALRLPLHQFPNEQQRLRSRLAIGVMVSVTLVPSVYLAFQMVRDEIFAIQAKRYVDALAAANKDMVFVSHDIDPGQRRIGLGVLGGQDSTDLQQAWEERLSEFKLAGSTLVVQRPTLRNTVDLTTIKHELQQDIYRNTLIQLDRSAARVRELEEQLQRMRGEAETFSRLEAEIGVQVPGLSEVRVTRRVSAATEGTAAIPRLNVILVGKRPPGTAETRRIKRWLAVRIPDVEVELLFSRSSERS